MAQQRLEYQPHVLDHVNQWFARGVAGAVCRSAERGRGIVLVDAGTESELVSRLAHSLSMWRLPTLRVLGVVQNTRSQQRTRSLVEGPGQRPGSSGNERERLQGLEVVAAQRIADVGMLGIVVVLDHKHSGRLQNDSHIHRFEAGALID